MRVENVERRRSEGRGLGRAPAAPGGRPVGRPVRSSVHAAATGRDRPGPVRSRDRGAVRFDVRHVDLARGVAAGRAVRRASWIAATRISTSAGVPTPRRLPRLMTPLRAPVTVTRRRSASGLPERHRRTEAVLRGASRHRGDAQELRPAVALLWVLPLAIVIGLFLIGVPDAHATALRGIDRPVGGVGLEHRPPPGTISRRVRTQSVRDGSRSPAAIRGIRSVRLPRWFGAAGQNLRRATRRSSSRTRTSPSAGSCAIRTASLVRSHPVLVASFLGAVVAAVAFTAARARGRAAEHWRRSRARGEGSSPSWRRATGPPGSAARSRRARRSGDGRRSRGSFGEHGDRARSCCLAGGPIAWPPIMLYRALRAHHRPSRRGGPWGRRRTDSRPWCSMDASRTGASAPGGAAASSRSCSSGCEAAFGPRDSPTDAGGSSPGVAGDARGRRRVHARRRAAVGVLVVAARVRCSSRTRGDGRSAAALAAGAVLSSRSWPR